MKKTVTFLKWFPKQDIYTDDFICRVKFSVTDTALIGTPREHESNHSITITITDILLSNWGIGGALGVGITEEMIKVALQALEEHITDKIKHASLHEGEQKSIILTTENSPDRCPYKLANILYPKKTSFDVELEDPKKQNPPLGPINIGGNVSGSTIIMGNSNEVQFTAKTRPRSDFEKIEQLMPSLLEEMRKDLLDNPTTREFFIIKRGWSINSEFSLVYYLDDHEDLDGKLKVLENMGFIRAVTYNNTRRFVFQEEFVDYLTKA